MGLFGRNRKVRMSWAVFASALMGAGAPASSQEHLNVVVDEIKVRAALLKDVSGVAADPNAPGSYLVVGNKDSDHVWRAYTDAQGDDQVTKSWNLSNAGWAAEDLESIDVSKVEKTGTLRLLLGEQHNVILSRRDDELYDVHPLDGRWMSRSAESCERGLEGLSVRWSNDQGKWRVALLWEGGYFKHNPCRGTAVEPGALEFALPRLFTFYWDPQAGPEWDTLEENPLGLSQLLADDSGAHCAGGAISHEIERGQKFRAPDLAWFGSDSDEPEELIVLLGSTRKKGKEPFDHTWLARFDDEGRPSDMCNVFKMEEEWPEYRKRGQKEKNWEALDTLADGKQLVLGYDHGGSSEIIVMKSPWADSGG